MRAVLDVNVLVSALVAPDGASAALLRAARAGRFELIVSPLLLRELGRALAYPKLEGRVSADERRLLDRRLRQWARLVADPLEAPVARSADPDDDYLIALASANAALLVSGDRHLLALGDALPVHSPRDFLELLERKP